MASSETTVVRMSMISSNVYPIHWSAKMPTKKIECRTSETGEPI